MGPWQKYEGKLSLDEAGACLSCVVQERQRINEDAVHPLLSAGCCS